ncbi:uncharacterized protein LOC100175177 [Ciona intestinalis]
MYGAANIQINAAMDNLRRKTYSESLKTTLNCYQLSSADSLSGPSSYSALAAQLWFKENKQSPPIPPPPLIQIPLLMPNDTSTQRSETILAGERISCFIVGGEKRLCLPQILTSVLREFSISEINRTCAELHIYCSRCSPDQLEILKVLGILPFNTTQCGLITKTDAERLVSALGVECGLNSKPDLTKCDIKGIRVYHECFGRGDGIFYPEFYLSPDSTCVSCLDCRISFSPARFVSHSHRGLEKHTCHWGFDPENWRNYLLVPKDKESGKQNDLENLLKSLKAKFNFSNSPFRFNTPSLQSSLKRKQPEFAASPVKKRMKEEKVEESLFLSPPPPMCYGLPFNMRSAFKPWHSALGHTTTHVSEFSRHQEALTNALLPVIRNRRSLPDPQIMSPKTLQQKEPDRKKRSESEEGKIKEKLRQPISPVTTKCEDLTPTKQLSPEKERSSNITTSSPKCVQKHPSSAVTTSNHQHDDSKQLVSSIAGINNQHTSPVHTLDSVPPLVAMSNAVAAASAMLELSSSGQHRNTSADLEKENKSSQHNVIPSTPTQPRVVPLDATRQHYKWSFDSSSHILSASGTQDIRMLQSLLEKGSDKQQIVHELVKMKSRFEEKLDIQARVKRDLEAELEQVKALKKRRLEEATDARNEMQQEMDAMRHEHDMRIQDVNKMLADIWKQVDELKMKSTSSEDDVNVIKTSVLDTIQKQVEDQEKIAAVLHVELQTEREKRIQAEAKLQQMVDGLHGRLPFLMDGHLSNMILDSGKISHENSFRKPSLNLCNRKSLQSLTSSSMCKRSPSNEEVVDVT